MGDLEEVACSEQRRYLRVLCRKYGDHFFVLGLLARHRLPLSLGGLRARKRVRGVTVRCLNAQQN
jgi:hypothetical protein